MKRNPDANCGNCPYYDHEELDTGYCRFFPGFPLLAVRSMSDGGWDGITMFQIGDANLDFGQIEGRQGIRKNVKEFCGQHPEFLR
jgi:hypothetical protein